MSKGTVHRTVRIEDGLWDKAKTKADKLGTNLSAVIRELLKEWADDE